MNQPLVLKNTDAILTDCKYIIQKEVDRLKQKVMVGAPLTQNDTFQLKTYIRSVIEMDSEERSAEQFERIQKMSDDELKQLVQATLTDNKEILTVFKETHGRSPRASTIKKSQED